MAHHEQDIIDRLQVLGLNEKQSTKAVHDRAGFIDTCRYNEEIPDNKIADLIWAELVDPAQELDFYNS